MASTTPTSNPLNLLEIPPEARFMIYKLLFFGQCLTWKKHQSGITASGQLAECREIRLVCRLIARESKPIFYHTARINIDELIELRYGYGYITPLFSASLLRNVSFHLGPKAHNMEEAVKAMTSLKQLTFTCDPFESTYAFYDGWSATDRISAISVAYIQDYPWRILGILEPEDHARPTIADLPQDVKFIITVWTQRNRFFRLFAHVSIDNGPYDHSTGLFDLATKILRITNLANPTAITNTLLNKLSYEPLRLEGSS